MEKNEISGSEITGDFTGVSNDNNKLFPSNFNDNDKDELIDQFDFSCGELFNPLQQQKVASSNFPPKFILQSQLSFSSPSECSFDDDAFSANAMATENRLSEASFILEYQQLYNSYTMCLTSLQDSVREVEALREQNDALRFANSELIQRLSMFDRQNGGVPSFRSSANFPNLIGDFSRLSIGSSFCESSNNVEKIPSVSPTSVISMPKSISVRSKGYLKSTSAPVRQQSATAQSVQQRVRVGGEKKAGEGLELDVFNQGMSKTELCNKWQETGACPYGNNCHFAHGISELRPVIRHPRYKTEVCRMVLSGDICPYGHRCHFRHSLTDEEMLMAVNPR